MCVVYVCVWFKIPSSHDLLDPAELQEEAGRAIGSLLSLTASPALSRLVTMLSVHCMYIYNIFGQHVNNICENHSLSNSVCFVKSQQFKRELVLIGSSYVEHALCLAY